VYRIYILLARIIILLQYWY